MIDDINKSKDINKKIKSLVTHLSQQLTSKIFKCSKNSISKLNIRII